MATIEDVVRRRDLEEYELPDWETRSPLRPLYVAPQLFDWVSATPRLDDGTILKGGRTPLEHLEQFFSDLRCARRPAISGFRRMMPTKSGLWKCHPETLRVFGWVCAPGTFVAVSAALEQDLKAGLDTYNNHMVGVRSFIRQHGLGGTVLRGDHRAVFPQN